MKCKYCDGTGTSNWCVNGTFINCPHCGGTGEVEQTNEECLRSLNTEQLAEWIVNITDYCYMCGSNPQNYRNCPFGKCVDKEHVVEWLKQPHTNE